MDLMDVINYGCWIAGGAIGYWITSMSGAPRLWQAGGLACGALVGGLCFYLGIFILLRAEERGSKK